MRTGIFGGTFNPVHNGHVHLAKTYLNALNLDRLLIIPTRVPPHKSGGKLVSGEHRLNMCQLAFQECEECIVSDIELNRMEKSYTVDTLKELQTDYPNDRFFLIMGSDMFLTLHEWYHYKRILELVTICVGAREEDVMLRIAKQRDLLQSQGADCMIIDIKPLVISSTEIRLHAAKGESLRELVPKPVEDYILQHGLYLQTNH